MTDIARTAAFDTLLMCEREGTYPNLALKKRLSSVKDMRGRRFAAALTYGVIEKKLLLDYYISKVSSVRLKKINCSVLTSLRMGLYQILFMSVPDSAACASSVELTRYAGVPKSAGFVNAVLRRLAREHADIPLPEDKAERMSLELSLPSDTLELLISSVGEDETRLLLSGGKSELYAAVNTLKTDANGLIFALAESGISAKKTELCGLVSIDEGFDIENSAAYKNGLFHIVGKPSYIAACAVNPQAGDVIYDMCAAPGGKSFCMSFLSKGMANVTAFDIHPHKAEIIRSGAARLGLENIRAVTADSAVCDPERRETADRVLCDLPCSGLGVIHKKPDIKYKKQDYAALCALQRDILKTGAYYLKSGGRLVYSTCTVNPAENGDMVNTVSDFGLEIDDAACIYGDYYGQKQFLPSCGGEGFYIAILRKK